MKRAARRARGRGASRGGLCFGRVVFTKRLREGIKRGRIRISIRIWMHPRVQVGHRYAMDDGHIVVDSIEPIRKKDITHDLARESGFDDVKDLLSVAKHGKGEKIYLVRFHYLRAGEWDRPLATPQSLSSSPAGSSGRGRKRIKTLPTR